MHVLSLSTIIPILQMKQIQKGPRDLLKVTQLVSDGAGIQTQAV